MFDFGKHADYMALGYALTGLLLGGMILWIYFRYWVLMRESAELDRIEEEERLERAVAVPRESDEAAPVHMAVPVAPPKET